MQSKTEAELLNELTTICQERSLEIRINPEEYEIKSPASIDVEHDEEGNLVGIGVYDGKSSFYWTRPDGLYEVFKDLAFIAHNGKGDFESLRQWGINVKDEQLMWDTELISHIIDSSRKGYGLKKLAKEDLGIEYPSYDDIVGKRTAKIRRTLDKYPVELVSKYNTLDCFVTYKLFEAQSRVVRPIGTIGNLYRSAESQYFNQVEKPVSYVFQQMENRGCRIDIPYLKELKTKLEAQQLPIKEAILNELGSINLNSPKQLLEALHAKQIFPELKGKPSTDKRAIERYKDVPTVSNLLKFSELDTLLSSFVYPYLERNTEVVKPFFNQCGTRTGRPSCSNPNLLQIPRRTENGKLVRRMFIPREGMLMGDCDFGQIEPRVMAHLSKDPILCKMFNDGTDFHEFTAKRLGISRDKAKVLNLSVGYRATFKSVMAQLGGTKDEAQAQINNWWNLFPALRRWQETLIYESKKSGFCTTLLGRRIKVDDLDHGNSWRREGAERQLINNITQGSAAEILKMAMIKIRQRDPAFGLLIQVYDELVWESPDPAYGMSLVIDSMVNSVKLGVPLTVDGGTGANWTEAKGA